MKKENTLQENIKWLLDQYKKELAIAKEDNGKNKDCEYGYSVEQFIIDAENIIEELGFAIEISK